MKQKHSMYRPLPPAGAAPPPLSSPAQPSASPAPGAGGENTTPDFLLKLLPASLARAYLWFLSTGEPSDTPLGRFADRSQAVPSRYVWRFVIAGVLIACMAAFLLWFTKIAPPRKTLGELLMGAVMAGAIGGYLAPLMIFTYLAWIVRYWRWVLGYAVLLAAAGGIAELVKAS